MPKTIHTIVNDNDLFDDNFLANCREEMEGEYLIDSSNFSDDDVFRFAEEKLSEYWRDEMDYNLNIILPEKIIAFADLGLWNGRVKGYNILNYNFRSIQAYFQDRNHLYVDGYGNLRLDTINHDGTNHYLFRLLKPYAEDYFDRLPYGITDSMIVYHTTRLGDYVAQIYGYKIPQQKQVEIVYNRI